MGYGTDFLFSGSGMIPPSSNAHVYKAPLISQLLHTIPRYNITLHRTNNTFRIRDEVYLEVRITEIKINSSQTLCPLKNYPLLLFIFFFTTTSSSPWFKKNVSFSSAFSESRNLGLRSRRPFDHLPLRPAALFDDALLRPQTEDRALHYQPQSNPQRRHRPLLCRNWTGIVRK